MYIEAAISEDIDDFILRPEAFRAQRSDIYTRGSGTNVEARHGENEDRRMFCQTLNEYLDFNDWSRLIDQYTDVPGSRYFFKCSKNVKKVSDIVIFCAPKCDDEKLYDANADPQAEGRKKVRDELWQMHMRSPAEALELALREVIERDDATTSMAKLGSKRVLPLFFKNGFRDR